MGSLLQDAIQLKKAGVVCIDLRRAALEGMALQLEKRSSAAELAEIRRELAAIARSTKGPSKFQLLAPLLQPLAAIATGAGLLGGMKLFENWSTKGVEDEVVGRFQSEFLATGRSSDQWQESGLERRVRGLHQDLKQIAPDVAGKAPAALSAIRPVAQRQHMPNFTEAEVKDLVQTQQAMRSTKPPGSEAVQTVQTIFKMTPETGSYTDIISKMSDAS